MGHLLKFKALGNLGVGPEHTFPFGIFLFEFLALFANSLLDNVFKQIGSKGEIVILKYNFEKILISQTALKFFCQKLGPNLEKLNIKPFRTKVLYQNHTTTNPRTKLRLFHDLIIYFSWNLTNKNSMYYLLPKNWHTTE